MFDFCVCVSFFNSSRTVSYPYFNLGLTHSFFNLKYEAGEVSPLPNHLDLWRPRAETCGTPPEIVPSVPAFSGTS